MVRGWRNAQRSVLRQQGELTRADQLQWFREVVAPVHASADPDFLLVAMVDAADLIAYGGLTNIAWSSRRAEVSFLAATDRASDPRVYAGDFVSFLEWLRPFAFREVGLHRLFTETWASRRAHIELLEEAGFRLEGLMRDHVVKNNAYVDAVIHGLLEDGW